MATVWGEITEHGTLRPYAMWAGAVHQFRSGERLRITIDKDRNGKFNSLFHLCLDLIAKAVNRGPASTSVDELKRWVKLKKGWYDVVALPHPKDGITHVIEYKPTAFAKMGEQEFHRFTIDACELIRDELAPWIAGSPEWKDAIAIINTIVEPMEFGR